MVQNERDNAAIALLVVVSFDSIYTAGKPPAAQAIKPAHLIDPIHAPTHLPRS